MCLFHKLNSKDIFDDQLLFIIKEEIIALDENIINLIKLKEESNSIKYSDFYIPEIKKVTKNDDDKNFDLNEYEKNRQLGENDSYICSLIRQDSVEEFFAYVNKSHIKLTSKIKPSIFETNSFLNKTEPSLIFQYLYLNNVKRAFLKSSNFVSNSMRYFKK